MANALKKTNAILDKAHTFLNKELFEGKLPDAGIILARKKNAMGYFHAGRFHDKENNKIDEIAINPDYLTSEKVEEVLSTVAHEMVHQWQHHLGEKKSRGTYHNREWANKMMEIGLMPSDTGKEGGAMVGQKMSHYIIEGAPFIRAIARLTADELSDIGSTVMPPKPTNPENRKVKYECPKCTQKAWGKPGSQLVCGYCFKQHEEIHEMVGKQ